MDYYHNQVTEKSWNELQHLRRMLDFTLIGGWAVYLYTKGLKSKDIDILVDFPALGILKRDYAVNRNASLKKYQAIRDMVEIDIYLPHYSTIGIPVEVLMKNTRVEDGITVLDPDYLCALKVYTLGQRGRTPKGRKDFIDILSLFMKNAVDGRRVHEITKTHGLAGSLDRLKEFLSESSSAPELDLNDHRYGRLKRIVERGLLG